MDNGDLKFPNQCINDYQEHTAANLSHSNQDIKSFWKKIIKVSSAFSPNKNFDLDCKCLAGNIILYVTTS